MSKIKIAIVGVGNCASSLVQGLTYYKDFKNDKKVVGLMHTVLGGYKISDIEVVAAFGRKKNQGWEGLGRGNIRKTK